MALTGDLGCTLGCDFLGDGANSLDFLVSLEDVFTLIVLLGDLGGCGSFLGDARLMLVLEVTVPAADDDVIVVCGWAAGATVGLCLGDADDAVVVVVVTMVVVVAVLVLLLVEEDFAGDAGVGCCFLAGDAGGVLVFNNFLKSTAQYGLFESNS